MYGRCQGGTTGGRKVPGWHRWGVEGVKLAPWKVWKVPGWHSRGAEGAGLAPWKVWKVSGWHRGIVWGCRVGTNGEAESVSLAPWKAQKDSEGFEEVST